MGVRVNPTAGRICVLRRVEGNMLHCNPCRHEETMWHHIMYTLVYMLVCTLDAHSLPSGERQARCVSDRGHLNHDPMLAVAFALGAATGTAFTKGLSLVSHPARGCARRIEKRETVKPGPHE